MSTKESFFFVQNDEYAEQFDLYAYYEVYFFRTFHFFTFHVSLFIIQRTLMIESKLSVPFIGCFPVSAKM